MLFFPLPLHWKGIFPMEIDIKKLAKLSKLSLTPEEEERYKKEIGNILDYVGMLGEIDTSSVLPTSQSTGLVGKERPDEVGTTALQNEQEALLKISKYKEDNFIKVPPVF